MIMKKGWIMTKGTYIFLISSEERNIPINMKALYKKNKNRKYLLHKQFSAKCFMGSYQIKWNFWSPVLLFKEWPSSSPSVSQWTGGRTETTFRLLEISVPRSCPFTPKPNMGETALLTLEVIVILVMCDYVNV